MAKKTAITVKGAKDGALQPVLPGLYKFMYDPEEIEELNKNQFGDLVDEVFLLRVIMRRALKQASEIEDLGQILKVLNTFGLTTIRIARLLEVQYTLGNRSPQAAEAIMQALIEVGERMEANETSEMPDIR